MDTKSCFVIIGYGKKTSYIDGKVRQLDLDQTYNILIKPVFDALGIPCYRAIDKNTTGSIDKLMLKEIKNAYIAIADISTLNANVMWELGVRHALQPHHTIMICEKAQMNAIPFDVNSFVIHQYTHSEEGIPYLEVERFREYLTKTVTTILKHQPPLNDSPVFTFLEEELLNKKVSEKVMQEAQDEGMNAESFASMVYKAEEAKNKLDYREALEVLKPLKKIAESNMSLKDNLCCIVSNQALCTYKLKEPNELEALVNAKIILDELNPSQSQDLEVLGLNGAINKRLFELTKNLSYLENSINSYEKGFQFKQDYYNGINTAFMLYTKASLLKKENSEWEDVKLKADYIRNEVLNIATKLESETNFNNRKDAVWVLYTIAEAYNYKKNGEKLKVYEEKADSLSKLLNDSFAPSSYREQKEKVEIILSQLH